MDLRIEPFIQDKTLVFTVTSDGYKDYTWNLWLLLSKLKLPWKLCILCFDKESYNFLQRIAGISCRLFQLSGQHIEHKAPLLFGTPSFKRMNRQKLLVLEYLSQRSDIEKLIFLDSDIAVFRDPVPVLSTLLMEHDLWFQCDEKNETFVCSNDLCSNPCTGIIAMHLTDTSRPFLKRLYTIHPDIWNKAVSDQDYIFEQLRSNDIVYKTLSRDLFPNGTFVTGDRYKANNPILLHFNYITGKDKKRMMKMRGYWLVTV
jgi:hypothetical protein